MIHTKDNTNDTKDNINDTNDTQMITVIKNDNNDNN